MAGINLKFNKIDKILRKNGFKRVRQTGIMSSIIAVRIMSLFLMSNVTAFYWNGYSKKIILKFSIAH